MADKNYDYAPAHDAEQKPGPFLARVVSHLDPTYMGILEVEILRPAGGDGTESQLHQVKYMSPFYGITGVKYVQADPNDYNNTQKSYGMWMIPPDPGTTVIVFFIDGDPRQGYWMGCVQDENANFMLPGIAATQNNVEGTYTRAPTAEYNKQINNSPSDPSQIKKPTHPLADALNHQGLIKDDIRGITTSSARREAPSMVFGISTPGPLDKRPGAKQGPVGKLEHLIPNSPVSRLGGTTFVMDDGDDKFLRKTTPKDGPPDYAAVEQGEYTGKPDIPHNELVRIRTRTGHEILLHNSEDLIYITNSRGTAWIELTSDGKIDIYAKDSISVHSEHDFNFYAGRDFNFEAKRNFNLKVGGRHQTEIGKDKITIVNGNVKIKVDGTQDETITGAHKQSFGSTWDVTVGGQTNMTISGGFDLNTSGSNKLTSGGNMELSAANTTISGGNINLNGPAAATAGSASAATTPTPLSTFDNPGEPTVGSDGTASAGSSINSIMLRIPTTEPYAHHENLDATKFKTSNTDRESGSAIATPEFYQKYTTKTDTFNKVQGGK